MSARQAQLETLLRTLKLPGMADMLGERLAQAAAGALGHAELLALLCGDETARRDAAGLARRLAAARFETTCAVEDFDFAFNPDVPAGVIRDLATLRFLEQGESVILHGPVGVGKTMLAQALGQLACRRGHSAAFAKTSRLLADLAGGHADRSWQSRLHRWARPAVLIMDLSRPRRYPDMSLGWMRLFLSRRVFWLGGGRRGRHNSAAGRDPFPSEHGASVEGGHDGTRCLDAR